MELIGSLVLSRRTSSANGKHVSGRRHRCKMVRTEEEKRMISQMIDEYNKIYQLAKSRGVALHEEKLRCKDIRFELIRLRAI